MSNMEKDYEYDLERFKIADFTIDLSEKAVKPREDFDPYCFAGGQADIIATFTKEEWKTEWNAMETRNAPMAANFCGFRALAEQLPAFDAFVLHSACFDVDGVGVAFAAHSGTGKTTHMMLWQQLLGDRMTIVNGDKPIVRFFDDPVGAIIDRPEDRQPTDGEGIPQSPTVTAPFRQGGQSGTDYLSGNIPFAYGTPWNGKEKLGCNMRTPLRHICFIERAEQNSCEPMTDVSEAITRIFNQVYMPKDPAAAIKTVELINRLMGSVNLWKIQCNMDPSAAKVAYDAIFG